MATNFHSPNQAFCPHPLHDFGSHLALAMSDGSVVLVERGDLERLHSSGYTNRWTLSVTSHYCPDRKYVYVNQVKNGKLSRNLVARLIAGAGEGQIVSYKNGDTRDLRRANLILRAGRTGPSLSLPINAAQLNQPKSSGRELVLLGSLENDEYFEPEGAILQALTKVRMYAAMIFGCTSADPSHQLLINGGNGSGNVRATIGAEDMEVFQSMVNAMQISLDSLRGAVLK